MPNECYMFLNQILVIRVSSRFPTPDRCHLNSSLTTVGDLYNINII
jgi:hypothetical protein